MKIAIDISPLSSGHKVRGVGVYVRNLKEFLPQYDKNNTYVFFEKKEKIPVDTDIVHYPYFDPFFRTLPLIKKYKTIVTVHDLIPLLFPKHFPSGLRGKIKWQIQKRLLKKINVIIADSIASKNDICRLTSIPPEKVHVVYLAAGEEFRKLEVGSWKLEIKKRYSLPDRFALYVGDATWNKNLPRLIEAIGKTDVPLIMVGKALAENDFDRSSPWNHDLIKVQKLIKKQESKNKSQIITLGFVPSEDLVSLYNLATVFVMPSLYEGFGLPVLEAMQSGCPVITSKEGSLPEIAGEAAFYVDAYDSESIVKGIQEVVNNENQREELIKKGFIQAKKFSWEKTALKTIEIYNNL